MSASQKDKIIDQLEDQIDALKTENDRLRDLIPQAWEAGWETGYSGAHRSLIMPQWMKQKGLA